MVILVIPCFNEQNRLQPQFFLQALQEYPELEFLFVNDGSTDATSSVLQRLSTEAGGERCKFLELPENRGKAEAVRQGMSKAFESPCQFAGYWDADLSTPFTELQHFLEVLRQNPQVQIVTGARVQLLGKDIRRKRSRHYLGRVFATFVSLVLDLAVYDTQCGAKLFRNNELVRRLFHKPFLSSWVFDVEILARFQAAAGSDAGLRSICELPLNCWHDIAGSKLKWMDFVRAALDLWRIASAGSGHVSAQGLVADGDPVSQKIQ